MKDFVEIQYPVLWKLCFNQSYFWLMETNIGIRGKRFSKDELIFCLVETVFFGQCYFAANRKHYWNSEKELISRLVETIFFIHVFWKPLSVLFLSGGKVFFKEILIFGSWKQILELIMVSTNRKIAVNKGILPPIDRNSDLPDRTKNGKKIKENKFISNLCPPAEKSSKLMHKVCN